MANIDQIWVVFREKIKIYNRNQFGNNLGADLGNTNPNLINNTLRNLNTTRRLVVEFPLFGESKNKDAAEWVERFTEAYVTNALDNAKRFRIVKGYLIETVRD